MTDGSSQTMAETGDYPSSGSTPQLLVYAPTPRPTGEAEWDGPNLATRTGAMAGCGGGDVMGKVNLRACLTPTYLMAMAVAKHQQLRRLLS